MPVDVGQIAPDFDMLDQFKQPVRLSDYRGKKHVTLVFYPMSFSSVCTAELCSLRDELEDFVNDESQLLAVSCDTPAVHKRLADDHGYDFPLLADFWPHGEVAKAYGVFDERFGVALRGTFVIDRDGVVRYRTVNAIPDARDAEAYKKALAEL